MEKPVRIFSQMEQYNCSTNKLRISEDGTSVATQMVQRYSDFSGKTGIPLMVFFFPNFPPEQPVFPLKQR